MLAVHLPIMVVASIVGVWLSLFSTASQPPVGRTSGNGTSSARLPNYRLGAAHAAVQAVHSVRGMGLVDGCAPWLTLWDDVSGRRVRFSETGSHAARRTT